MGWHMHEMSGSAQVYLLLLFFIFMAAGISIVFWTLKRSGREQIPSDAQNIQYQQGRFLILITTSRISANIIQLLFSFILVILSLHLIHLAIGHIINSFNADEVVVEVFSAIWLITVALAVFDLAGIIFEEISWDGSKKEVKEFQLQFVKFLIVIINALLLESMVVFFKVAKKDVSFLMYPALSLFSVCILIVSLAIYIKFNRSENERKNENAFEILKNRYARGEINNDEFQEKMEFINKYHNKQHKL